VCVSLHPSALNEYDLPPLPTTSHCSTHSLWVSAHFFFACSHESRGDSKLPTTRMIMNRKLRNKKEAREAGRLEEIEESRGGIQIDGEKGKRVHDGQAWDRKKACVFR